MKSTKTISYLSQVWGRVGKEMKSQEEENEDEETNGASNSGEVGVHRTRKEQSGAVVASKPGSNTNLDLDGMKISSCCRIYLAKRTMTSRRRAWRRRRRP